MYLSQVHARLAPAAARTLNGQKRRTGFCSRLQPPFHHPLKSDDNLAKFIAIGSRRQLSRLLEVLRRPLQKVLFQLAAPITAAARSLMGSRSPSDARFRMRNAISDFSILALRSFGNDDHASSSALRRSFSVSGSYAPIFLALKPNSTSKPLGLSVKSPT